MDFSKINTNVLRGMLKLSERKEALLRELEKVEAQISSHFSGNTVDVRRGRPAKAARRGRPPKAGRPAKGARRGRPPKAGRPAKAARRGRPPKAGRPAKVRTSRKRAPRGAMKAKIFKALAEAGALGLKVPELSKKIGAKSQNVHVWFSNTGKKLPEIKRIGKGHFRLLDK